MYDVRMHHGVGVRFAIHPIAGIDNHLYYMDKTLMLLGDAKAFVASIVKELSVPAAAAR